MPAIYDAEIIENRPPNVAVQFLGRVAKSPDNTAFSYPQGEGEPWKEITWAENKALVGRRVEVRGFSGRR